MRHTLAHVSDPPKKHTTTDKTEPLNFQRVGLKNKQPRVIRFGYFVVPFGTRKC
jgi:hypothetical protein